jgi:DNA (cytosine-5)-methyltransferase 1
MGWEPVAFSEIEPFPCAVLKHHYPNVPNWGDMTNYKNWPDANIDLLVGGTPCQSFSIAGLRKGLDDPRGNLMLTYLAIAERYRPKWILWENVPGVLSSNEGRDFGTFLTALGQLRYGYSYRVLDAQYFGVAQRRRRVFVVGHLGSWQRAAAVLLERSCLSGHPAPSRQTRKAIATDAEASVGAGSWWNGEDLAGTLTKQNANGAQRMPDKDNFGAVLQATIKTIEDKCPTLNCNTQSLIGRGSELSSPVMSEKMESVPNVEPNIASANAQDHTANQRMAHHTSSENSMESCMQGAVLMRQREGKDGGGNGPLISEEKSLTLATSNDQVLMQPIHPVISPAITTCKGSRGGCSLEAIEEITAIHLAQQPVPTSNDQVLAFQHSASVADSNPILEQMTPTLRKGDSQGQSVMHTIQVRRLTPVECERLQGFPDNFTRIPWKRKPAEECPDGPRYKALGNSMAVPCMRWIGERIDQVNKIP